MATKKFVVVESQEVSPMKGPVCPFCPPPP